MKKNEKLNTIKRVNTFCCITLAFTVIILQLLTHTLDSVGIIFMSCAFIALFALYLIIRNRHTKASQVFMLISNIFFVYYLLALLMIQLVAWSSPFDYMGLIGLAFVGFVILGAIAFRMLVKNLLASMIKH